MNRSFIKLTRSPETLEPLNNQVEGQSVPQGARLVIAGVRGRLGPLATSARRFLSCYGEG